MRKYGPIDKVLLAIRKIRFRHVAGAMNKLFWKIEHRSRGMTRSEIDGYGLRLAAELQDAGYPIRWNDIRQVFEVC